MDMLRSVVAVDQRHARRHRPRCQVLREFPAHGARGDDVAGGDQLLDLAADVGRAPGGVARAESVDGPLGEGIAIQRADRNRGRTGTPLFGCSEAEIEELLDPAVVQVGPGDRDDLVGAGVGPGSAVPRLPEGRSGLLAGVVATPLRRFLRRQWSRWSGR